MFWLKIVGTFLKTLKEGATPSQIALGFVLGWAIGMVPGWPLQVWGLLLLLLILQANLGIALAAWALAAAHTMAADNSENRARARLLFLNMFPPDVLTRHMRARELSA